MMKPTLARLLMLAVLTIGATYSMEAASQFENARETGLYVIGSVATVREGPRNDARITAKLPIGTKVTYIGTLDEIQKGDRYKYECPDSETPDSEKWVCIGYEDMVEWGAWVAMDLLGQKAPDLNELVTLYDKTAKENLPERRKWAERATALDPLSAEAQKRLLDVLTEMGDQAAYTAAKKSFATYQNPQPSITRKPNKLVFAFNEVFDFRPDKPAILRDTGLGKIQPIADLTSGQLQYWTSDRKTTYDFGKRGQIYYLYSRGSQVGTVITEGQFECTDRMCFTWNLVRARWSSESAKVHAGLAVPTVLPKRSVSASTITQEQKKKLQEMAQTWVKKSDWSAKVKKTFLKEMQSGGLSVSQEVAQLSSDGRVALIGVWVLGSMDDAHYNDGIYQALLIIAEQQQDGTFRLAPGSGSSIADHGCGYFDHADIDGDGTDEIALFCEQLEGSYSFGWAKRVGGTWKILE